MATILGIEEDAITSLLLDQYTIKNRNKMSNVEEEHENRVLGGYKAYVALFAISVSQLGGRVADENGHRALSNPHVRQSQAHTKNGSERS